MRFWILRVGLGLGLCVALSAVARAQMFNPKIMSGRILPVTDVPAGTMTVRVIRGSFDKNVPGQTVEFTVNGEKRTAVTDASGRAQLSGLPQGARVRAMTVVDGERLESQEAVIGGTGLRTMLVATDRGAGAAAAGAPASAAPEGPQLPNPKDMSGQVLPATDVPAGTVTVRVIRGNFDKNVTGQTVEFTVDGQKRTAVTDASGRAQVADLPKGAHVRATAVVDGERLESQEAVVAGSGFRIMLVATDPNAAPSPVATRGTVTIAPTARMIAELANERLTMYYSLDIVNASPGPVDIGGPLVFKLPTEARGTTLLQGSTKQAQTSGPRVTVTGPFAPGTTSVQFAYEMPYTGGSVRVHQQWPAAVERLTLFAVKVGALDINSPQLPQKQNTTQQGQPLIVATGSAIQADHAIDVDITGLPFHALWPRYLALALSGVIVTIGIWAAVMAPRRRAA